MVKKANKIRHSGIFVLIGLLALATVLVISAVIIAKCNKIIFFPDDLGVPYADLYTEEQANSRLSEDMTVFDGKLYVGGGDYGANTGPVYVMSYDLASGKWEQSSSPLEDEQIKRFRVLGGKLTTLGTDPRSSWDMGNYYLLEGDTWNTLRVLPSGIHCFDAIEHGGETFFGLGVNSGDYPVTRFDGEKYTSVEFYKDGVPLDTSAFEIIRVYNLFEFKNILFAFLTTDKKDEKGETVGYYMELYAYNNKRFEFAGGPLPSADMPEVATDGQKACFVLNDSLLATENLMEFSAIKLAEGAKVSDIIKSDGSIFALTWREIGNSLFEISVYGEKEGSFEKLSGFFSNAPANAFCKNGNDFYISLGKRDFPLTSDVGRVVRVTGR